MARAASSQLCFVLLVLIAFVSVARAEPIEGTATLSGSLVLPVTLAPADLPTSATLPQWSGAGNEERRSSLLTGLHVGFAALQALDVHSTLRGVRSGHVERNPVIAPFASEPGAMIAIKAAATTGTIVLSEKLGRKHRGAAIALMIALNAGYAVVVARNYRQSRP